MADEEGRKNEPSQLNLTITEDHNSSIKDNFSIGENEEAIEPYSLGFGLAEYYKLCLSYYHKEKKIIKISYDDKLQLTAFWKQVTCGSFDPEKIPDVGYFDVIGSDRKNAWEALGDMSRTEAMENFCILLEECSPELKPWMEAQHKEVEEIKRKKKEVEERQRREAQEAAERERQKLAEEEARKRAEEDERRRIEEIEKQEKLLLQQKQQQQNQVDGLQQSPRETQQVQQFTKPAAPVNQTSHILPASLWTRPKVMEFIQHVKSDPNSVLVERVSFGSLQQSTMTLVLELALNGLSKMVSPKT
ncbi:hypothetical protein QZH41_015681 [Actinostola sp. cb2023]|nr:hypothetical protein QZH41_015681 [Actinostola sp. cb2023]